MEDETGYNHSYLAVIEDIEPDKENIPDQLEDIKEAIKFLAETARNLLPNGIIKQRAEAYWFSQIVTALDDDNEFIVNQAGQMCDTIRELQE
jgi:uncharacterized protein YjgD (DUF1641 family)